MLAHMVNFKVAVVGRANYHEGQQHIIRWGCGGRGRVVDDVEVAPGDVVVGADEGPEVGKAQEVRRGGGRVRCVADQGHETVVAFRGDISRGPGDGI